MRLDDLCASLPAVVEADRSIVDIVDVEHDSRRAGPGHLFACVPGQTTDGHDHAPAAIEAGAVAVLVERRLDVRVPQLVVPSVREAMGPAAAAVHGDPSSRIPVIGVTGTNGKTTTVRLIGDLLKQLGASATEIGTLTGVRTTPEAPELQRVLAEAHRQGHAAVAMEVSSHALDLHRVDGTRFAVGVFTNLGIDHLDFHGDLQSYEAAKARLFTPKLTDLGIVSTDTEAGERITETAGIPIIPVDTTAREAASNGPTGSRFRWRGHEVSLPLAGPFNVTNAALAAEAVAALGYDVDDVAVALGRVRGVPGRFETVHAGQAFTVVIDYAHTPDGLEAVLAAAREITERTLIVVFGAGGDRDQGKRPQMGEVARRLADRVVVTSDNPRGEAPEAIIAAIVSGMDASPELVEVDRRRAIRHAIAGAREGDVVLIAGKGHETTQTIGDEVLEFDDRVVAHEELRRLGGFNA
ncbi:MAG: UDP-N-acetylmuramoyl-L-alanyl-D-glutamate--2,6-diaminopimelate ligase [Actinomycetota bacterium]|nr:UDP-N-acetylmuramoyl-L-alanyl-D-glutamate--2,6-diaminopimelate ligase [Actinomycetota bacterium]